MTSLTRVWRIDGGNEAVVCIYLSIYHTVSGRFTRYKPLIYTKGNKNTAIINIFYMSINVFMCVVFVINRYITWNITTLAAFSFFLDHLLIPTVQLRAHNFTARRHISCLVITTISVGSRHQWYICRNRIRRSVITKMYKQSKQNKHFRMHPLLKTIREKYRFPFIALKRW